MGTRETDATAEPQSPDFRAADLPIGIRNGAVETHPMIESTAASPLPHPPSRSEDAASAIGLSRSDRTLLLALAGVVLLLGGLHLVRLHRQGGVIEIDRPPERTLEYRIDINTATWVEWMQLDEIGETMGRSIVADREARGPFRSIDDIRRVKGIGPKTMEVIRPHLKCQDCPPEDAAD